MHAQIFYSGTVPAPKSVVRLKIRVQISAFYFFHFFFLQQNLVYLKFPQIIPTTVGTFGLVKLVRGYTQSGNEGLPEKTTLAAEKVGLSGLNCGSLSLGL